MRKILLLIFGGFSLLFYACNNATETASEAKATNTMAEKNLASSRIVTEAFQNGDPSKIDSAVAKDFVDHRDYGDVTGPDSLKAMITQMKKQMPDVKTNVLKEVGDDDYVFTLIHFSGNSDGSMGMPKGPFDMHSVEVTRFKDGMAVEHWGYMQPKEFMKMMPPTKVDEKVKK